MLAKQRVGAVVFALVMLLLISSIALAAFSINTRSVVSAADGVDVIGEATISNPEKTLCIRLNSGHSSVTPVTTICQQYPSGTGSYSCNIPSSELINGQELSYSLLAYTGNGSCTGTATIDGPHLYTPTAIELASMSASAGGWFYPALLGVLGLVALALFGARALRVRAVNHN